MKSKPTRQNHLMVAFLSATLTIMSACSSDSEDTQNSETAPVIPPASSMVMSFDEFPENTTSPTNTGNGINVQPLTVQNFSHAATHVVVWNTLITVGLAVPVAAFLESFNHFATIRSDGTWVWTYSVNVLGSLHVVELHAKKVDENIVWELYVTRPGFYQDFNWISGVSSVDGSEGYWILRETPQSPNDLLRIDWTHDKQNDTGTIQYTNIKPDSPENGGYIAYGADVDMQPYDAYYDIYNKGQDNLVEIEWNRTTKAGRVRNANFFGDTDWHYWDEQLQDYISAP
jgi:hypothetical protein